MNSETTETDAGLASVIIPTFNRAYCIGAAIESLQDQSYTNWEAVVIDDGSSDDTSEVFARISAADPRVRYFRQPNQGVSAARNAGLDRARGRWIGFLDSDDSWQPWKLEAQIACMTRYPEVGMVWTDMDAFDVDGNLVSSNHLRKMYSAYRRAGEERIFQRNESFAGIAPDLARKVDVLTAARLRIGNLFTPMIFGSLVHTSTALLSRDRLAGVGRFESSYRTGEDYDFHLRTCRLGQVALLDASSIRYRVAGGEDQLTSPSHVLEMALNGLHIRERAVLEHRDQIDLDDRELRQIMSYANLWVAEQLFTRGDYSSSRRYLRRGLAAAESKHRLLAKIALTYLPKRLTHWLVDRLRTDD